jgi:hypothetical protein
LKSFDKGALGNFIASGYEHRIVAGDGSDDLRPTRLIDRQSNGLGGADRCAHDGQVRTRR